MRDLSGLARACRILLLAQAVLSILAVAQTLATGIAIAHDDGPLALVQLLLGVAAAIAVLIWVYRSTANAHASGADGLGSGPGLAVAWYFIPIANLFKPVQTMAETWKASIDPKDWEPVRTPASIGWWWAFWLISSVAGTAAWRIGEIGGAESEGWAYGLSLAGDMAHVPASLLLAHIIGAITARQAGTGHQHR